ncbi:MAG: zf-HC2 domain-containing protein [Acidimicrobiia bacterium]|nr:zf-HC2 domain-containing protein [Acidimicrobiia bacterium]
MTKAECKEVFALLSQYLDGELPEDVCEQMDRHIGDCPPCVEFLASLKKTAALCRQMEVEEKPPELAEEARASLVEAYRRFAD